MNKRARELLDLIGSNPYFFNFLQKACNLGDLKEEVSLRLKAEPGYGTNGPLARLIAVATKQYSVFFLY